MDQTALFKLSYGLYIVSTAYDGKQNGCVVNTLTQVTSEPARLAVTVNKANLTAQLIEKSGLFNAVVLTQDAPIEHIGRFGFARGADREKYDRGDTQLDENGLPYTKQYAAALFSCKVVQMLDVGTHMMFIGEVTQAEKLDGAEPMTYAYYHQVKKGTTPKNAPSYQKPAQSKKTAWKCKVCGYIYEGDTLPEDFVCPVCKQPASAFEKI
ncbi:MAG: flavin reductase [Eubacteriales bacterium]|nr:flavin reductase [Eubacteriales bacterium]